MDVPAFDRAQRPVIVAPSMRSLNGTVTGCVRLPLHIDWTPANTYELGALRRVVTMYQTVLQEAKSDSDLAVLNGQKLREVWGRLRLPANVREAWERAFPELAELR